MPIKLKNNYSEFQPNPIWNDVGILACDSIYVRYVLPPVHPFVWLSHTGGSVKDSWR